MGSEGAATVEALAAGSDIAAPVPSDTLISASSEDGAFDSTLPPIDATKFDTPKSEKKDELDAQSASGNGDAGSGWLNASSQQENTSGWLSADGAPVTLPPAAPSQPWLPSRQRILYLARIPRSIDEKLRVEIKSAETKLEQTIKKRDVHRAALQEKKNSKMELLEKLKPIREKERACRDALQGKRMELEPFSLALNKFRSAQNKGQDICSSEEELNDKIAEIQYRIQHESIPLKEEKQLLREIKQLESTRSQVCANSVLQAELMENLGPKEDIRDQVKFLHQDLDSIRKEHRLARAEYDALDREINILNEAIEEVRQQFEKANAAQQDAYAELRELKRQENLKNDPFYQNRRDVQVVRELASQKKLKEVEDFCTKQVEDFLAMWNKESKFRTDYTKSNERSTVRRLETLDGRSLGPNEKPPVISDSNAQPPKSRDAKPTPVQDAAASKASKISSSGIVGPELSNGAPAKETKHVHAKDEEAKGTGNGEVSTTSRQTELDEERVGSEAQSAEQKEKLRQDQMTKAKEAEERKRKRSEKLESRALARAKKDAERKEKEREKKAQKKVVTGSSSNADLTALNEGADSQETIAADMEPAAVIAEEGLKRAAPSSTKDRKGAVGRKKMPVKDLKTSRPPFTKRPSKKADWPIPIWAIALLAVLVLVVALIFFLKL